MHMQSRRVGRLGLRAGRAGGGGGCMYVCMYVWFLGIGKGYWV